MSFAAEQAARRVDAHPSGAGKEHLGPGVQGEDVGRNSGRLIGQPCLVRELDQIATDETGSESPRSQRRDEQHRRIATAAPPFLEGLLRIPDARLLARDVADALVDRAVDLGDQRHRRARARERREELLRALAGGEGSVVASEVRRKVRGERAVRKRRLLREGVEGEVERVDGFQVQRKLDRDLQRFEAPAVPRYPRDMIARGVLLPADLAWFRDVQAVALDARAGMRGGPQPHQVRPQHRGPRIVVAATMLEEKAHS